MANRLVQTKTNAFMRGIPKLTLASIHLAIGLLLCSGESRLTAQQNIVQNGNFQSLFDNWYGLAAIVSNPNAPNGVFGLGGDVYQDLATTPGQLYLLDFYAAADLFTGPSMTLAVALNHQPLTSFVTPPYTYVPQINRYDQMRWAQYTSTFVASATTTRLEFIDQNTFDFGLASVSVTPIAEPLPPMITCPEPLILECANGSAIGSIQVGVSDSSGYPLEVIWTVDGTAYQTNDIPSGGTTTSANVTFAADFGDGEHDVLVSASNGQTAPATCTTTVTVRDTSPPSNLVVSATPNVLWPPNHRFIPVTLMVDAADNCDPVPSARIVKVTSNERRGRFAPDWRITGPLSVELRAERLGYEDRIYTVYVQVTDSSGNESMAETTVTVPKSQANRFDYPIWRRFSRDWFRRPVPTSHEPEGFQQITDFSADKSANAPRTRSSSPDTSPPVSCRESPASFRRSIFPPLR